MREQSLTPQYLRVRNWENFQHYKDRRPPWIKLHVELTDDYLFAALTDVQKYHLIGVWLLAARTDNKIPNDPGWVAARIEAKSDVDLAALIEVGFLVPWKRVTAAKAKWPSRYISKEMRAAVLERDSHTCRECNSTKNLEIDHIIPVSRGGTGEVENLQALCRSCNRAKRNRTSAEQVATQTKEGCVASVLTETEAEQKQKAEREKKLNAEQSDGPALPDESLEELGARLTANAAPFGSEARLFEVLSDMDKNSPKVLRPLLNQLSAATIEQCREEVLAKKPRRPTAYAVEILTSKIEKRRSA